MYICKKQTNICIVIIIQTWRDWKANVLKKCIQNKSYAAGIGGGPPKIIPLTQIEKELLEILSLEVIGLDNIPQKGTYDDTKRIFRSMMHFKIVYSYIIITYI